MHRPALQHYLQTHTFVYPEEKSFARHFLDLLTHPRAYHRDHLPGHVTASAWVVDPTKKKVLLTHHAKLNRWLQPGGHADGMEDVAEVALKEAQEETGLLEPAFHSDRCFDIDIHPIPARKDFPRHMHYDVRFLFIASTEDKIVISGESHDLRWVDFNEIGAISEGNLSMLRMLEKTKTLFAAD